MRTLLIPVMVCFLAAGQLHGQSLFFNPFKNRHKKYLYSEVSYEDLIRRYLEKESGSMNAVEGIYSVSCIITKRGKPFLSGREKEQVVERKDNYARVAIIKERPGQKCDYLEISLSYREPDKYPIMGELNVLAEGRGIIYKHIEPDGSDITFSMTSDSDLIEGEYSLMKGSKTITYKLSYLRIFPKSAAISSTY